MLQLLTPTNPAAASGGAVWQTPSVPTAQPATGTAIPVVNSLSCYLAIPAGASTNTLAAPTYCGQRMSFLAISDAGGSWAITSATAINQAGNTIMTFADAQDFIMLEAVATGAATLRWQVVANDGVALS